MKFCKLLRLIIRHPSRADVVARVEHPMLSGTVAFFCGTLRRQYFPQDWFCIHLDLLPML